jgi:nicotinamidase-related amidase
MQNDFMRADGALSVPGADKLIAPANKWLAKNAIKFDAIIYSMDTHDSANYALSAESKQFGLHCNKPTYGWQPAIKIPNGAIKIEKPVFNIWEQNASDLEKELNKYLKPEIYIMGVAADFCVRDAIAGFLARGYNVKVLENLTRGIARQMHQVAREDFANYLKTKQLELVRG